MTINDIEIIPGVMRMPNADMMSEYTDEELINLQREPALKQLDIDLRVITGVTDDDYSDLLIKYEDFVKNTLCDLQCKLYYFQQIDVDNMTDWRYNNYANDYENDKLLMKRLTLDIDQNYNKTVESYSIFR